MPSIDDPAAEYDPAADALGSYNDAVAELRRRHRRAIVQDEGGPDVRLILFAGAGEVGAVRLDLAGMIALAGDLCAAARRRMAP